MRFKYLLTAVLFVSAMFFGCACAKQSEEDEAGITISTPSPVPLPTQEARIAGGDLFLSMPVNINTLDPILADSDELINLLSLIYETPLKYDSNGRLKENLVESWTVDETRQNFSFKVRDDVYFSDGTKMTADDIVYTAKRLVNPVPQPTSSTSPEPGQSALPEQSGAAPSVSPVPVNNADTSLEPGFLSENTGKNRYSQFAEYIVAIEATDPLTVELKTSKPGVAGLHFMTFPVMKNGQGSDASPIGTGPYAIREYIAGKEMQLVPNERWWGGRPYIESIVARSVENGEQALNYVQSSIIDFTTSDALYAGNYREPGKIQVLDYTTNYYDCLVPNLLKPVMQDVNVRQAITYGIDRREILSTVLLNHGIPTNLPISPDYYAYDPEYKISNYGDSAAKDFLKTAGYRSEADETGKVLTLRLLVSDSRKDAYCKEAARAIKKQLSRLGIDVTVDERQPSEYLSALKAGDFDLAYVSYYLDVAPDIAALFDEASPLNIGHVGSAEIEAVAKQCELAVTEEEAIKAYSSLQEVLAARVPQIGLYFRTNSIVCDENIHGISNIRQGMIFNDVAQWYNYVPGQEAAAQPAEEDAQGAASITVGG